MWSSINLSLCVYGGASFHLSFEKSNRSECSLITWLSTSSVPLFRYSSTAPSKDNRSVILSFHCPLRNWTRHTDACDCGSHAFIQTPKRPCKIEPSSIHETEGWENVLRKRNLTESVPLLVYKSRLQVSSKRANITEVCFHFLILYFKDTIEHFQAPLPLQLLCVKSSKTIS